MYNRKNTHPDAPGQWTTEDGEYEFTNTPDGWQTSHRAHWNGSTHETVVLGRSRTLAQAFELAGRHHVAPAR